MSQSIYKGVPYVAHNKIQYMNMRGRVVLKMTAFVPSTFGLTTIEQAYIPPPPLINYHQHHTSPEDHLFS